MQSLLFVHFVKGRRASMKISCNCMGFYGDTLFGASRKNATEKKKIGVIQAELALKSIPHPGIFGGFGRNVFFLQYGDFIKKPEVLILLSKTTT